MRAPARVLVVDDDPVFVALVAELLVVEGHQVITAEDGRRARAIAASSGVDLVVLDRFLPDLDALHLAAQLGASATRPPIILVSASWRGLELPVQDLHAVGIELAIHKPILAPTFVAQVAEVLARAGFARPPVSPTVADALQALRADYTARLPERLTRLATLARQAFIQPASLEASVEARTEAHRLHGTAGSYGFPDLGELAGRLEDALESVQAASLAQQEELLQQLARAQERLAKGM